MKKRNAILVSIISIICIGVASIVLLIRFNSDTGKNIESNYGISNTTHNITNDDTEMEDIDEVVPDKDEVIKNLEKEGYTITQYNTIFNTSIEADRIYAAKNGKFIDICYGLTDENAEDAIKYYEDEYKDFYLMARNANYVYCISDKKTFKKAGFKSLANVGVQYICD